MDTLYRILWNTHGWKSRDISEEEFDKLTTEFLELRKQFGKLANSADGYDKFSDDFKALYPTINDMSVENVDSYMYGSYLAWRMNDAIRTKMAEDPEFMKSDLLEPYIFMDGNVPDLGMRLKHHGDWTMDMLLKVAD